MRDDGTLGDAIANDGVYSATIPGQAANTVVAFYLSATDNLGGASRFPALLNDNAAVPRSRGQVRRFQPRRQLCRLSPLGHPNQRQPLERTGQSQQRVPRLHDGLRQPRDLQREGAVRRQPLSPGLQHPVRQPVPLQMDLPRGRQIPGGNFLQQDPSARERRRRRRLTPAGATGQYLPAGARRPLAQPPLRRCLCQRQPPRPAHGGCADA